MELADEEQRHRAGISLADDTGLHGPAEVVGDQAERAPRRCFFRGRIERNDQRGLPRAHVHLHGDRRPDDRLQERHDLLRESAQDDARVGSGIALDEVLESFREAQLARAHGRGEQLLLRGEVAEDRRGGDAEVSGDVGEGGRGEAALGERCLGGVEDLLARNARWTAHAYVNVRSLTPFVNSRLQIRASRYDSGDKTRYPPNIISPVMAIATVNPATGETIATFEPLSAVDIEQKLQRAADAFVVNRKRSFAERAGLLRRVADILDARAEELARTITIEMGKPIKASVAEVQKCAMVCRHYADHGEAYLAEEHVATGAKASYVRFDPLGAILAVMPWNFPFWQVFRFAAPALMAGNVGLLKHASNVPQCALAIEDIFREAGFDAGEFQTLLIGADQVAALLDDDRVKAATLTGGEAAGASVASAAAKQIKKSVLELGGSDPLIVMASADMEAAVKTAIRARIVNNGQSCIAAKRFIVHEEVADEFEKKFVAAIESLKVGDPLDESVDVGPMAMPQIVNDLEKQVAASIDAGATLLTGGKRIGERGNFYAPTVLRDIPDSAPVFAEETFGPVASLFRVKNVEEAIMLANATEFGLGASVWTNDDAEADRFIAGIEAGLVFVNAMVASDPRIPFGGVKRSGFGRELGVYGIREFVNIKTVWIA